MKKILTAILSLALACGLGLAVVGCGGGEYMINVSGGGSGVGISSAKEGTVEMGMASKKVEGEDAEGLEVYAICQDGIAVVVNNANTAVTDLTIEQLSGIYTGQIDNWSELGGSDAAIAIGQREDGSGTRSDTYRRVSELSKRNAFSRNRRMSSDTSSPEYRYFRGKPLSILLFYAETWKRGVRGRRRSAWGSTGRRNGALTARCLRWRPSSSRFGRAFPWPRGRIRLERRRSRARTRCRTESAGL